ncbi:MAG: diheme cytochrome c [Burkholderiaceae bacterium]
MNRPGWIHRTSWLLVAFLGASHAARAGDDQRGPGVTLLPTYTQECAACHVAFPPGMLPPDSWRRLLSNLPRHYGTDASLDAATVNELATWLRANAGTYKRVREAPPEDRITKSAWFVREHDEVPAAAWQRPAVKSAANCTACHTNAARGDFNEHSVRIPR